ncbi:protein of unknown function [Acetoanaerobium sticklandii]|uniref:HTH cro/C1-type domain-containing protein n=1 Tax=Acetoanaerobium sticklandii (strain ATCC 12662 / DSM 519 / JCM 1433 / CCUG 9281 / NCIMB 10654 / HF) TaxID=499177 RepID=E3PVT7_ACESD|nr:protein of unknown function [Acetoanaerobium sticklandii]
MTIGERIRQLRRIKDVTQRELAESVNFSHSYIGDLERNRTNPSIKALEIIAEYFNVDTSYLIGSECCYIRLQRCKTTIYGIEVDACTDCPLYKSILERRDSK